MKIQPSDASWVQAARANLKHWPWFLGLFAFELWLAIQIPRWDVEPFTNLNAMVDWLSSFAPVIHNFDKVASNPLALSLYFAIAVLAIVPKSVFFFLWLNSSRSGMYRHFVVSPLTAGAPKSFKEFIDEPLRQEGVPAERPRSLTSGIAWSLLILILGVALIFSIMQFGWEVRKGRAGSRYDDLVELARGGLWLWFHWSVKWSTFAALLAAIAANVARDYLVFLRMNISRRNANHRDNQMTVIEKDRSQ